MRRARSRQTDDADVDMTPMLDIVFIMLIFFIVTATFLDEEGIDLTIPDNNQDNTPSEPKPAITVYVDDQSQCSVDGRRSTCDRVALSVERLLAEKPNANIILRVSEVAQHGTMVALKDEFDSSGLNSVIEVVPAQS